MPPGTHRRTQAVLNHDLARCSVATAVAVVQTIVICFVAFDDRPMAPKMLIVILLSPFWHEKSTVQIVHDALTLLIFRLVFYDFKIIG